MNWLTQETNQRLQQYVASCAGTGAEAGVQGESGV